MEYIKIKLTTAFALSLYLLKRSSNGFCMAPIPCHNLKYNVNLHDCFLYLRHEFKVWDVRKCFYLLVYF